MALPVSGKPDSRVGQRRLLRPGWPLYVVFVGFPFWWVLGMAGFIWPIVAIPMLLSLFRRQRITAPPAFILWIGFVTWMLFTSVELDTAGRSLGVRLPVCLLSLGYYYSSCMCTTRRQSYWRLENLMDHERLLDLRCDRRLPRTPVPLVLIHEPGRGDLAEDRCS